LNKLNKICLFKHKKKHSKIMQFIKLLIIIEASKVKKLVKKYRV